MKNGDDMCVSGEAMFGLLLLCLQHTSQGCEVLYSIFVLAMQKAGKVPT